MKINLIDFTDIKNCPVRQVLDRIGDKWSVLIILLLGSEATLRFNSLHKSIPGISQKMLTITLRTLETDGIITRQAYAEIPPRVEYTLSELGKGLLPHIKTLSDWAYANMSDIIAHREASLKAAEQTQDHIYKT